MVPYVVDLCLSLKMRNQNVGSPDREPTTLRTGWASDLSTRFSLQIVEKESQTYEALENLRNKSLSERAVKIDDGAIDDKQRI